MSKATKRKHVTKEVMDEFVLPEGNKQIMRVVASRGNNLHEVETHGNERFLASMPTKFRKNVWIKRGDFVMTEPIEEGDKVKAEIVHILYKEQIKYIQENNLWPDAFAPEGKETKDQMIPDDMLPPSDDSDCEEEQLLMANPNRPLIVQESESEDDDSEDESDEDPSGETHPTRKDVHFN